MLPELPFGTDVLMVTASATFFGTLVFLHALTRTSKIARNTGLLLYIAAGALIVPVLLYMLPGRFLIAVVGWYAAFVGLLVLNIPFAIAGLYRNAANAN